MLEFNIERNDLEQIESLLRITTNIDKLYTKLCKLEIENKKDTDEYTKNIHYLSILIEEETKLYNKLNLTFNKTVSWINFLLNIKQINGINLRETLLTQNYDNHIIIRILNNLTLNISKDYNKLINLSNENLEIVMKLIGIKISISSPKDIICKCIISKIAIENDIHYAYLSFLQEEIHNPKQTSLRDKLITNKYNTAFINRDIESYTLTNNFNIKTNNFIISNIVPELLEINQLTYKNIQDLIGCTISSNEIYELLEISDLDYCDITKVTTSVLRQCMINSAFLFMSGEKISDINYEFHEYTDDKEYLEIHPNSNISYNLIINSFNSIKENRAKTKILSLK